MVAEIERLVTIETTQATLEGNLAIPSDAAGLVLFAHGSGSSRFSPRNQFVAQELRRMGIATLLFDLLEQWEAEDRRKVFDVELLADRLMVATDWVLHDSETRSLPLGYFGASTGAAAALIAAAELGNVIKAVVSRGGRPDLAQEYLQDVKVPTLLIVGGEDWPIIPLNREAFEILPGPKELVIIPGAGHLFEEPGALEEVARLAGEWFKKYLGSKAA
ncbi:MAG: dienelactone hydrolase family protein [Armatimonadota bacterium]|nr:dienelactone hydrolase family protein [Armatimonadota bacterium]